jgi:hypothetical protein
MLGGQHHGIDTQDLVVVVAEGELALGVGRSHGSTPLLRISA